MDSIDRIKAFAPTLQEYQHRYRENKAIQCAIKQVRAKPDMRVCNPGRWRVFTCPLTSMVVVERTKDRREQTNAQI